ncbi:protein farnesyltransferase subunit beta [Angomonas deanei]|nr:protein farnesyltransferase subunit beta [Angomonas deanei]|eukprot:EPY27171.1 protein farnesyltransferase subunit beta [Angomonas deanei]
MSLPYSTTTLDKQRETELEVLRALSGLYPEVFHLWRSHPDYEEEEALEAAYQDVDHKHHDALHQFHRQAHVQYLQTNLNDVYPSYMQGQYPTRPWLIYWCLQGAALLGAERPVLEHHYNGTAADRRADVAQYLMMCLTGDEQVREYYRQTNQLQDADKIQALGFAGGPSGQVPHLACSYAAVCALALLGGDTNDINNSNTIGNKYLANLPRLEIKKWLLALKKQPYWDKEKKDPHNGCFMIQWGGEVDVRASYCVAIIASLLRLDDPDSFLYENTNTPVVYNLNDEEVQALIHTKLLDADTLSFIVRCQTHEGGFACHSYQYASEAHGAYTHCALAAYLLHPRELLQEQRIDLHRLRRWLAARQCVFEGGFNGRTNKLVDSCYSYWIGGSHALYKVCESMYRLLDLHEGTVLCARDVVFLDHAQLVDGTLLQVQEDSSAQWEKAEHRAHHQQTLVEQFLSSSDSFKKEADKVVTQRAEMAQSILSTNRSTASPTNKEDDINGDLYFHQVKLQQYIVQCAQNLEFSPNDKLQMAGGGLRDKPPMSADPYHTCYAMSGFSASQNLHYWNYKRIGNDNHNSNTNYIYAALQKGYLPKRFTIEETKQYNQAYNQNVKHKHTEANKKNALRPVRRAAQRWFPSATGYVFVDVV